MASKETWDNYFSHSFNKGTDEEIQSMILDMRDTIRNLERMYGAKGARLVVNSLLQDYNALINIAKARYITYASL